MEVQHDDVTAGLQNALGQYQKIVTIASAEAAAEGHKNTTVNVVLRKLKARQFVKIFEQIDVLVRRGVVRLTDDAGKLIFGSKGALTEFRDESMILRGGEPLLEMISIATGLKRSHVDDLDLADLAKLVGGEWEVNERFFAENQTELKQALGPIWKLVEGLTKKKSSPAESSQDSSISSSAEATEPLNK